MANKCYCTITLVGPDAALDRLQSRAGKPFSLDRLYPTPADMLGDGRWYGWRIECWGTKWDLSSVRQARRAGVLEVRCVTPWGPPAEALRTLSGDYPELSVRVAYRDEDGTGASGEAVFSAGIRSERRGRGPAFRRLLRAA